MRNIIFIFFCFLCYSAYPQKLPDYGLNKVRITQPDKIIVAEIEPVSSVPSVKSNLFYYWYNANIIHTSQGGFSGKLLNGLYTEYYTNKNLKEQGHFKKGLKDGVWKSWNDDGSIAVVTTWKSGSEVSGKRPPIWKRIHPFRKKIKAPDSLSNVKK
jgi:antitoxin component YwqK of YwqJK toxin-antitoxin module